MLKRGWFWTIVGGLLPVAAGFAAGTFPPGKNDHAWAYPIAPNVFLGMSVALALAHVLIAVGYDDIADRTSGGAARSALQVGGIGLLIAGGTEIWSGTLARVDRGSQAIVNLNTGYAVAGVLVLAGTLGAGIALARSWTRVAVPLLVNGVILLAGVAPAFAWSVLGKGDAPRIAALTVWNLSYVWLGLALKKPRRPAAVRSQIHRES